jgi:hypothetical protein
VTAGAICGAKLSEVQRLQGIAAETWRDTAHLQLSRKLDSSIALSVSSIKLLF